MSNNKQTAVEWLIDEIEKHYIINNGSLDPTIVMELKRQAKAIHKEEIIKSWMATDNELQRIVAEQYYNETFGG
jgi:hypothetical protein